MNPKHCLPTSIVVFVTVATVMFLWFGGNIFQKTNNELVGNEIINTTIDVSGRFGETVIPIPPSGVYKLVGGTSERGDPKIEIGIDYSYWVYSSSIDKFGTQNTSHITTRYFMIGTSDDNTNVDRIFTIPENAVSANIFIYTLGYTHPKSSAKISVCPTLLPEPPNPPKIGELVNCSRYTELVNDRSLPPEVLQYGVTYSSDGASWFNVPGRPDYVTFRKSGYSWYASDKYTEYVFPANLTVLNKSSDLCKVIP